MSEFKVEHALDVVRRVANWFAPRDELFGEAYIRAAKAVAHMPADVRDVRSWLARSVWNGLIDWSRGARPPAPVGLLVELPASTPDDSWPLPEGPDSDLAWAKFVEGRTYPELGVEMGLHPQAVYRKVADLRKRLKRRLSCVGQSQCRPS